MLKSKPLEISSSSGELPWEACLHAVLAGSWGLLQPSPMSRMGTGMGASSSSDARSCEVAWVGTARVTVSKGWVIPWCTTRSRVLPAVHHLNKGHWDLQRRSWSLEVVLEEANFEMTFSDRITCIREVAGLPKTSS